MLSMLPRGTIVMRMSESGGVVSAGSPNPLGATITNEGVNFAVYSEHAESIVLCLFSDDDPQRETEIRLPSRSGHIWHGFVAGLRAGQRYGYRVEGPWSPHEGHLFNPRKLLLDPYAGGVEGHVTWDDALYGCRLGEHPDYHLESMEDSASCVPRSVVIDHRFDWSDDRSPRIPMDKTVLYETHVKGMTALHPDLPPELRGTYAGFTHPAIIDHLRTLGVTSIELQPVHAMVDEEFLVRCGLRNYWGYNTIGFFAPEPRYAHAEDGNGQVAEFKHMVRELHRHGFEIVIDVVYNHTAEGGRDGPTLSFRGLDNRTYYRLDPTNPAEYINYSGTGNTINIEHRAVLRLVLDSMRQWVTEYHIDGFRFDLAPALGRDSHGFSNQAAFFSAVYQDPVLSGVKLIAEPWDVGPGGYQLGHFPEGWSEWNDRYRDSMRAFWLGHSVTAGEFALRMSGSADLYKEQRRGPLASINYVTCHDGFTLSDLVSYDRKHNQPNNEHNQDGHNHNLSRNFGVEGATNDPLIIARRARARRNLLSCTLFAHGVPMILGGDELSRTQLGNNNAYAQDNEHNWYDWATPDRDRDFEAFVARAIRCRTAFPQLRRSSFRQGELPLGIADDAPAWREPDGRDVPIHDWGRQTPRTLQLHLSGNGSGTGEVVVLFNAESEPVPFVLPDIGRDWFPVLDTADPRGVPATNEAIWHTVVVDGESLILLSDRPALPS